MKALSVFLLVLLAGPATAEISVVLLGKPTPPKIGERVSLDGTPDRPAAGDLVRVDDVYIRLDGPGLPALRVEKHYWGRVYVTGDPPRPLAVSLEHSSSGPKLAAFTNEELRGLRGLYLGCRPKGIERSLSLLDPRRCAIHVGKRAPVSPSDAVPPLPPDLENLVLDSDFNRFDALRRLTRLRVLVCGYSYRGIPCRLLAPMAALRVLRADIGDFDPGILGGLADLRELDLSSPLRLTDIEFVRKLRHLRILNIEGKLVTDLTPLSDHPSIREIDADVTEVSLLPRGKLPSLRHLTALSARVPEPEAARFRRENPKARLHGRSLRWDRWPADGPLTAAAAEHLATWLGERIPNLRKRD